MNEEIDALNIQWNVKNGTDQKIEFLKDSTENEDKWKFIWIWDVYKWYLKSKKEESYSWRYTKEEMEEAERLYWDGPVLKGEETKWKDKATAERLKQANQKSTHWEKFKEMCLILLRDKQITEKKRCTDKRPFIVV